MPGIFTNLDSIEGILNHLRSLLGNSGPMFQGTSGRAMSMDEIIQYLIENDPNNYGTPPASKVIIESLFRYKLDKKSIDHLAKIQEKMCPVCQDELKIKQDVVEMPCKHIYHPHCLEPWLKLHNSCPTCRYELPTDDDIHKGNL